MGVSREQYRQGDLLLDLETDQVRYADPDAE